MGRIYLLLDADYRATGFYGGVETFHCTNGYNFDIDGQVIRINVSSLFSFYEGYKEDGNVIHLF